MPRSLELHIDELVLHGFLPRDRYAISAAIESELLRLLSETGIPPAFREGGITECIMPASIQLKANTRPEQTGTLIAGSIFNGLSRGASLSRSEISNDQK